MGGGALAGGQHGVGEGQHGVGAVLQAGGAGVVGAAGQVQAPAPVRPYRARGGDRVRGVGEVAALLHVQFHERVELPEQVRVGTERFGVVSGVGHGLGPGGAVGVGEGAGPVGADLPGGEAAAQARHTEAAALLLDEDDHGQGALGGQAAFA